MQNGIINVNGEILNFNQARISVFDRGFLYGDSLYEVARTYNGTFFLLDEHLRRLENSAALCRMTLGQKTSHYRDEILRTFQLFREQPGHESAEAYCRLIVTRGVGKLGFGLGCITTPTQYVILVQPVPPLNEEQLRRGYSIKVVERLRNDRRALDPAMKSGNYLNSLLAHLEAASDPNEHYDDALMRNSDDFITEGTTYNIFYVRRGMMATPPLDSGILDGLTRRQVLNLARDLKFVVREVNFNSRILCQADEVFLTSTLREIFPITRINGKPIGSGKPGPVTMMLRDAYQRTLPK